jgi:hypothetical protein
LFQGIGYAVRDPEWNLEKDGDAAELGERTLAWFESIDKRKSAAWEKRIATWQPLLALLMALIAIVGPRILHTRGLRAVNLQKKEGGNGNGNANANANGTGGNPSPSPVQGGSGSVPGTATRGATDIAGIGRVVETKPTNGAGGMVGQRLPGGIIERPFRREDWGEQFGVDD